MALPSIAQNLKTEIAGSGTPAPNLPAPPTPGNFIVCCDVTQGTAAFATGANGWVKKNGGNNFFNARGSWYTRVAQVGDTATLPVLYTGTVANAHTLHTWEVANCIDEINDATGSPTAVAGVVSTPLLSPNGISNALFLAVTAYEDTTTVPAITVGAPWTLRSGSGHTGPIASASADYLSPTTASQQATFTNTDTLTRQATQSFTMALWGTTVATGDGAFAGNEGTSLKPNMQAIDTNNSLDDGARLGFPGGVTNDTNAAQSETYQLIGSRAPLPAQSANAATDSSGPNPVYAILASSDSNAYPTDPGDIAGADIIAGGGTTIQRKATGVTPPRGQMYKVMIFNVNGDLVDLPQDITTGSFEDVVNGGSSKASFQVPRSFFDAAIAGGQVGPPPWDHIDYNFRVHLYLWDYEIQDWGKNPWWDGRINEFDQEQLSNQEFEDITVYAEGWSAALNDVIVTETLTPGQQPAPGQSIDLMYADGYLNHLISTYLDPNLFGTSYIPDSSSQFHVILDKLQFDGETLGRCIDTVVSQVLDNTTRTYEWWVRGLSGAKPGLVVQPNNNPNSVPQGRYAPGPSTVANKFLYDFKNSTFEQPRVTNSITNIVNMIALYGGQDPASGVQIYGAYKDSTSISLYGLRQKKVTNANLLSILTLGTYATAYILLNGYPQPQYTMRKFYPTDRCRAGQWMQLMEPSPQQMVGVPLTPVMGPSGPPVLQQYYSTINQFVRQMRIIKVETTFTQENLEQHLTLAAPRPYIDSAYYGAIHQASNDHYRPKNTNLVNYCMTAGGDWDDTDSSGSTIAAYISAPAGKFNAQKITVMVPQNDIGQPSDAQYDYDMPMMGQAVTGQTTLGVASSQGSANFVLMAAGTSSLAKGTQLQIQGPGESADVLRVYMYVAPALVATRDGNAPGSGNKAKWDHVGPTTGPPATLGATVSWAYDALGLPDQTVGGDGYYEVLYCRTPFRTWGVTSGPGFQPGTTAGPSGDVPAMIVVKGVAPFDYDVLKLWGFTIINSKIVGAKDLRIWGGSQESMPSKFLKGYPNLVVTNVSAPQQVYSGTWDIPIGTVDISGDFPTAGLGPSPGNLPSWFAGVQVFRFQGPSVSDPTNGIVGLDSFATLQPGGAYKSLPSPPPLSSPCNILWMGQTGYYQSAVVHNVTIDALGSNQTYCIGFAYMDYAGNYSGVIWSAQLLDTFIPSSDTTLGINIIPDSNFDFVSDWDHSTGVWLGTKDTYWLPLPLPFFIGGGSDDVRTYYVSYATIHPSGSINAIQVTTGPSAGFDVEIRSSPTQVNPGSFYTCAFELQLPDGMEHKVLTVGVDYVVLNIYDADTHLLVPGASVSVPVQPDGSLLSGKYASLPFQIPTDNGPPNHLPTAAVYAHFFRSRAIPDLRTILQKPQLNYGKKSPGYSPGIAFLRMQGQMDLSHHTMDKFPSALNATVIEPSTAGIPADGSYITTGVVTYRTLATGLQQMFASALTTGPVTVPIVGANVSVPVQRASQAFATGVSVCVSNNLPPGSGGDAFIGRIIGGGMTTTLTVQCTTIINGLAGDVMAPGAVVVPSG